LRGQPWGRAECESGSIGGIHHTSVIVQPLHEVKTDVNGRTSRCRPVQPQTIKQVWSVGLTVAFSMASEQPCLKWTNALSCTAKQSDDADQ
jgi:hypothetical protein